MNEPVNIEKRYRIGELDQRVQILSPTEVQSSNSGEVTATWGEYATRFASVTPLGGNERIESEMLMPVHRARFVFRYDSNITEKCRLVWALKTFDIQSIEVVPRNRFLIITAQSNDIATGSGVNYGDYYSTNSLKLRYVTGAMLGSVPTSAEVTTAVGLTPSQAGAGYAFLALITKTSPPPENWCGFVLSDGTKWVCERMEAL